MKPNGTESISWDDAPLPYQSLDGSGRIRDVNDAWCTFTGYDRDDAVGREYREFVPPEHSSDFEATFALFQDQGRLAGRDCFVRTKQGDIRNILIYGRTEPGSAGPVSHCMLVDVTAHRATEKARAESESRYRLLFDLAPNPIVVHDGAEICFANEAAVRFLGYDSVEELVGTPMVDLVAPESRPAVAARVKRLMTEDWTAPIAEEEFIRKDGTIAVGATVASPTTMGGKRLVYVAAIDLAERREAEEALKESEERFRRLFELSADAIVVHDGERVLMANHAAYDQFGVPEGVDVTGANIARFLDPEFVKTVASRVEALKTGADESLPPIEVSLLKRDGSAWEAEASSAIATIHGQAVIQTTFRDTTERRATERELARYRAELERLVEERTKSLARVRAELGGVTEVIGQVVELRDPYTAGHQRRVAALSVAIAEKLGMTPEQVHEVRVCADLHDIGKISVPAEILSKPGHFSALEYALVKCHVQSSYDILCAADLDEPIAEVVYQHHERLDGSGYPRGLSGDEILPGARVIMVADVVEAMTSHRPYRPALGLERALEEIRSGRGRLYDAAVVDACDEIMVAGFDLGAATA